MRKFLLLFCIAGLVIVSKAQEKIPLYRTMVCKNGEAWCQPQRAVNSHRNINIHRQTRNTKTLKSLSTGIKLNEQEIGSAGNLLTVDEFNCNQIDVDSLLQAVMFIHRNDPTLTPGTNIAQYRYDLSKNNGTNWTSNIGPITSNPPIDDNQVNSRFPQGSIYNPAGNTNFDSAYVVYSGTWHDECPSCATGTWVGQIVGNGQLSGNIASYNVLVDTIDNGTTAVASSFCQSSPGVFWNLNEDYNGTFSSGSDAITSGIIVEKGVWNSATGVVNWSSQEIYQTFDSIADGGAYVSIATSFDIAFDPSGQYGWIACLGDVLNDSVYEPIFWQSIDSGNTWSGPIQLRLDSIPGVVARLPSTNFTQQTISQATPTTMYEGKLTVDYLGNPHFLTTVDNGAPGYEYYPDAGYTAYDFTYNASPLACDSGANWNGWSAVFIDSVETLEGTYTSDGYTEDNRPLVARSADGTVLFFYWLDSDIGYCDGDNNCAPNLFTRAFDLAHYSSTPVFNLTLGDSLFGGQTTNVSTQGIFLPGANYPVISPTAIKSGTNYNVPLVLTEIDYEHAGSGEEGSGVLPAQFWYIDNITFEPSDFSNTVSVMVLPNGPDTVSVFQDSTYVDSGATIVYLDTTCHPTGLLQLVTVGANISTGVTGYYYVYYYAEDSSGNVYAAATRLVQVVAPPFANFAITDVNTYEFTLRDLSTNNPTGWLWTFGDGTGSELQNPTKVYNSNGTFAICLIASNQWGSSAKFCQSVLVTNAPPLGINDVDFSAHVNLFPNPTSGKVTLSLDGAINSDFNVKVYDVLGEQVAGPIEAKAGTAQVEMDLSLLSGGTYLVKIQSSNGTAVKLLELTHSK